MTTSDAAQKVGSLPRMPHGKREELFRLAMLATVFATVFSGIAVALQVEILAPYRGTSGDPVMKVLAFVATFAFVATLLKFIEVAFMAGWLERQLGTNRQVRFRDVLGREVRRTAFWGGSLQAAHAVLFVALIPILASSTLAAAKALVIIVLPLVEMRAGIMQRSQTLFRRLTLSIIVTVIGAGFVIMAGGFHGFKGWGDVALFVALVLPGNVVLAVSECIENDGVHLRQTAAGMYTVARFIAYFMTCIAAVIVWGALNHGYGVAWAVVQMCLSRSPFLILIAFFWGVTDLLRLCSKPVVSASYMYVVMSGSVAIAAVVQSIARLADPKVFFFIKAGWLFPVECIIGGAIVMIGAWLFPQPKQHVNK